MSLKFGVKTVQCESVEEVVIVLKMKMFTLVLLLSACFVAGASEGASISSIRMADSSLVLEVGETATLTALIDPDSAGSERVNWIISNTNIVTGGR